MRAKDVYSKKITSEEEREGYFLVLKDRLDFFPDKGKRFQMVQNGHSRRVMVESYPCSCRGPDEPHSHYYIKLRSVRSGDRVNVRKDSKNGSKYLLQVQAHPRRSS